MAMQCNNRKTIKLSWILHWESWVHLTLKSPCIYLNGYSNEPLEEVGRTLKGHGQSHVPQLLYIHSSVDGHLGCLHALAIINSVAVNTWVHVFFSALVSSGYMPHSGIAGSYGVFSPVFKGISIPSSIIAVSIYIPTNSVRAFPFLHTLSRIYWL